MLQYSYLQLCLIFVLAILLKELDIFSLQTLNYRLFAYILPLLSIPALLHLKENEDNKVEGHRTQAIGLILTVIFLFIFIVRLLPYMQTDVPLGYDPGFYKYAMDMYIDTLPDIPEDSLPGWLRSMYPQGLFVLTSLLHIFAGFDPLEIFGVLFPFICAFLVLPVYALSKQVFNERVAVIAALLYALSYTQYTMFTFLYIKNVIGLILLLLALYLLEKKAYPPLVVIYAGLGIYHRPEFLLFSLILIPHIIHYSKRSFTLNIALSGTVFITGLLILPFWLPRLSENLLILQDVIGNLLYNIRSSTSARGGGTFFDLGVYELVSLTYLPFGIIAAFYVLLKRKWSCLFYGLLISGIIVIFQLFFYNRLIIPFDLLLIIFAGAGLDYAFIGSQDLPKKAAMAALCLLFISSGLILTDQVYGTKPLLTENQLDDIEELSKTDNDAYILATSYDAPWVLGWSSHRVLAPGLFQWDIHNRSEWMEFLATDDPEKAIQFLSQWNETIYIYHSYNTGNALDLEKFNNSAFIKKWDNESIVYEFDPADRKLAGKGQI